MLNTDLARFAADDPDPLISASFACPYCLRSPAEVTLSIEETFGSAALCRCDECRSGWVVALNYGQSMRMALAPPLDLALAAA
jgi:hypothetical protein